MNHLIENLYISSAPDFGAGPSCEARLLALVRDQFEIVISFRLREPFEASYHMLQLDFHHFPVEDFGVPSTRTVESFLELMERQAGHKILLHCHAGLGRSGTMAALYLRSRGMTGAEAIRLVREKRPGAIETPEQEEYILRFDFRRYFRRRKKENPD